MHSEVPQAEPAPTRRSSRTAPTPVQATPETAPLSRAELRRRNAAAASQIPVEQPPVVWDHREDAGVDQATDMVEPAAPVVAPQVEPAGDVAEPTIEVVRAEPLTRRRVRQERAATRVEPVQVPVEPFALVEPEIETAVPQSVESRFETAAMPQVDEFAEAARLFSFTGETPVLDSSEARPDSSGEGADDVPSPSEPAPPRRTGGALVKQLVAASFSIGVIGVVGLLTVGLTTPAAAVAANRGDQATTVSLAADAETIDEDEIQAFVTSSDTETEEITREENYSTATMIDRAAAASISNPSSSVFTNNPSCDIQWPFEVGVPMSYGFGMRSGKMHEGIDFTPGSGAHIQAIADGVVRVSTEYGATYGVTMIIDHMVDGQLVSSRYAHMQYGSRQFEVGDHVSVGDFIGLTGNTGLSYGAHTHFEVLMNGTTAIDPLPWLRTHAVC
ncbi:hypothetical protein GCM10022200_28550 [Microbacterium awajiense]|uniref:M23ase beta-sheet core domain-containing protein n=1 Tax=Microbacterium awajiense TaxID=415214 RepID=A0ABP7AXK1_9MICO